MIEVGEYDFAVWGRNPVEWDKGSLRDFLASHFAPEKELAVNATRIEKLFTART